MKSWVASKPEYVSFVRVPVVWSDVAKTHARAFYTAEALGKVGAMHDALFREIHDNHDLLDTEDKLRAFFGTFGVDAATFKIDVRVGRRAARSCSAPTSSSRRYRVASVPTIVVNGKYSRTAAWRAEPSSCSR